MPAVSCSAGLRRFVAETRGFCPVSKRPQVPAKDVRHLDEFSAVNRQKRFVGERSIVLA